jgi:hypothetical protein
MIGSVGSSSQTQFHVQAGVAMEALRQAAAAEARMAQLLAQSAPPAPGPASSLGSNVDTWV